MTTPTEAGGTPAAALLAAHNALEREGGPDAMGHWMRVNCLIHPDDDIFAFFANHALARNPVREYLSDGWRTLSELMVLLEGVDRPLLRMGQVLEFGAGFGRFTRHLARVLPGRLTAADVLPGTTEFLRDTFGVKSFASARDPAGLRFPGQYDLVFVLSVFTHLPPRQWAPWLRALEGALAPGGLLVLTVHNEEFSRGLGVRFDEDGTKFLASSESPSVDGEVYGTTLTTRAWAEAEVARALGRPARAYAERAFWHGQDAVVIERPA